MVPRRYIKCDLEGQNDHSMNRFNVDDTMARNGADIHKNI